MSDKFDSRIAEYLYTLSLESMQDDEIGSVDELGWYARFDGSFSPTHAECHEYQLTADYVAELATMGGAILFEDSQGFVYATTYTRTGIAAVWITIEDDYSLFDA